MRFESIVVRNFRSIRHMELSDLSDMVLIAGPNGCGKTASLDAIRLLKSIYGGYEYDEWRHWFQEFQIDLNNPESLRKLLRDNTQPLEIAANLTLADSEIEHLKNNATSLLEPIVWRQVLGRNVDAASAMTMATELRVHGERVKEEVSRGQDTLLELLKSSQFRLGFTISPDGDIRVINCLVADVLFQTYDPTNVGVIEYHSASRTYVREGVGGVALNLAGFQQHRRAHSLYNSQNKFQNVKTELASNYVQEVFSEKAGTLTQTSDLNDTLRDLFQTFFPNKTYEGPRPTSQGTLEFPVKLASGEEHDIDDLSSGEKEILYGYLRLRNSAPRNSIVLLDEPELHLNPSLLQGLADFYHRHLGRANNNQLWLVTHSDALLRQAVGNSNFSAFHLRTASTTQPGENQVLRIDADAELDRAIIDLVGDLATYKPNAKVVILEGGGDKDFDVRMVSRLFPDFALRVNIVSGGPKQSVKNLYGQFTAMAAKAGLTENFFAIVDRDSGLTSADSEGPINWDRYHIENYLLEPRFIIGAMGAVASAPTSVNEKQVVESLKSLARDLVPSLVSERLQLEANDRLISTLSVGSPSDTQSPANDLKPSIEGSLGRFIKEAKGLLESDYLGELENEYRSELEASLDGEGWASLFPGRRILAAFVHASVPGVNYEAFRNLVLDQMVDERFEPSGMKTVLESIDRPPNT